MQNFSFLTNTYMYMYHSIIALNDNFCNLVLQLNKKKKVCGALKKLLFWLLKRFAVNSCIPSLLSNHKQHL